MSAVGRAGAPWRQAAPALLAAAVALAALYAAAAQALHAEHRARLAAELEGQARRLAAQSGARWPADGPDPTRPCPTLPGLRVRVVVPGGAPACMPDAALPEDMALVTARVAALEGRTLHSDAIETETAPGYLAVTAPVRRGGQVVAALQAVRMPLPPAPGLAGVRMAFALGALALAVAVLGAHWLAGRHLRGRSAALAAQLTRIAGGGEADVRGAQADPALGPLAGALADAAAHLQARLAGLTRRLEEREAVLASMVEGVLALDPGGRLLEVNAAAGRLFAIDPAAARGRDLLEVVRHTELQRFVRDALASPVPLERELTLYGAEPRHLQAHGSALRDAAGRGLGTLVVLNDVTHLRRLERMRQDFVANVSHEIKTPITSIKGFVETLQDGAVDDPATARRFLAIVARHAERLNAITDDLLKLSRIEQESERGALHTEEASLAEVLRGAVGLCTGRAEARGTRLVLACDEALHARINPQLVEQAVVNLVDNAIKYAPERTEVRVEAERAGGAWVIRVRDQGPGIPAEHLPRLFERFYRVDKARSRKAGGTGLGLAIVKHIAQAHGGRVEVASRLGEGSTFTLHLPAGAGRS